jgi:hypothetical protein
VVIKAEVYRAQTGLTQWYKCQNFGHVWAKCKQPPGVYGVEVATSIKNALRRKKRSPYLAAATVSWERGKTAPLQLPRLLTRERRAATEEDTKIPS